MFRGRLRHHSTFLEASARYFSLTESAFSIYHLTAFPPYAVILRSLESEFQTHPTESIVSRLVRPDITRVRENSDSRRESPFNTGTSVPRPLEDRIKLA